MDCRITSISSRRRGMSLVELMVAVGIGSLVCLATLATLIFSLRSFAALTNYQDLNVKSRMAIDVLSTDIRQAIGCSTNATFSASDLTLNGTNPVSLFPYKIKYSYDSNATTLTRT